VKVQRAQKWERNLENGTNTMEFEWKKKNNQPYREGEDSSLIINIVRSSHCLFLSHEKKSKKKK
jgi:hypothetical protein